MLNDWFLSFSAASLVAWLDKNTIPKIAANINGKLIARIQNDFFLRARTTSKRMTVDKLCILLLLVVAAVDLNKDIVERLAAKLLTNAGDGAVSARCAILQQ